MMTLFLTHEIIFKKKDCDHSIFIVQSAMCVIGEQRLLYDDKAYKTLLEQVYISKSVLIVRVCVT